MIQSPYNKELKSFTIEVRKHGTHGEAVPTKNRDGRLEALGYQVLRVREGEVLNDLNNVLRTIEAYLPEEVLNDQSP
jgi:very-short-patch-repair endonuclease